MDLREGATRNGHGSLKALITVVDDAGSSLGLGCMRQAGTTRAHGQGTLIIRSCCAKLGRRRPILARAGSGSDHASGIQPTQADIAGMAGCDARHGAVLRKRTRDSRSSHVWGQPVRQSVRRLDLLHRGNRACCSWREAFYALLYDRQLPRLPPLPLATCGGSTWWLGRLGFAGPAAWSLALCGLCLHR